MTDHVTLKLTNHEKQILTRCIQGELENDEGEGEDYFRTLRRVVRKLTA